MANEFLNLARSSFAAIEQNAELKLLIDSIVEVEAVDDEVESAAFVVGATRIEQTRSGIVLIQGNDRISFDDLRRTIAFVEYLREAIPAPRSIH